MAPGSAEHIWAMGHALRQGARHWEYARDDQVYGVPRAEVLDDDYHKHLAMLIRGSRPKVAMTDHIRLSGDGPGATDLMSQMGGAGGKPRLVKHDEQQPHDRCASGDTPARGQTARDA